MEINFFFLCFRWKIGSSTIYAWSGGMKIVPMHGLVFSYVIFATYELNKRHLGYRGAKIGQE